MNPRKHAPAATARGYRYARYRRRLVAAVVLSLLTHAFLLSLQFGLPGLGLPGVELPWHQRRAQPTGLSVLLSGARRAPEIADMAETPVAESAMAPPDEPWPVPAAMPQEHSARTGLRLAPADRRRPTPATVSGLGRKREGRHDAAPAPALRKRKKASPAATGRRILTQDDMGQDTFAVPLPVFEDSGQAATPAPSARPELVPPAPPDMPADAQDTALAEQEQTHAAQQQAEEAAAQQAREAAARMEEDRRLAQESEARRLAEAAEAQARQQREEEQARQALEREAKRLEEQQEERRQAEEVARRQAAALALQQAEQLRREQENAVRRAQEEVQRREALRLQEEQDRRAALELEARRQAEQAALRRRQEEEQAARQRAEAEARRQAELAAERQREQAAADRSRAVQAADALNGAAGGSLAARALAQARKTDNSAGLAPLPQPPMPAAEPARRRSVLGRIDNDVGLMMYVESWRLKIERNGRLNYRQSLVDSAYTEPVVTVAVRSDGSVEEIILHRSSGRPELDEAVRRIVQLNARYAAFPPELARRYDVIEIRRMWTFDGALRLLEETR